VLCAAAGAYVASGSAVRCAPRLSDPTPGGPPVATAPSGEGRLHLIIGPMFAGKTTELLRLAGVEEARLVSLCQVP